MGFFLGKSVVKFIFFHLNFFFPSTRGNPNYEPNPLPSTKYRRPSIINNINTFRLFVDFGRMGFGRVFLNAKLSRICLDIMQHMCILMSFEPSMLPVKMDGLDGVDEVRGRHRVMRG